MRKILSALFLLLFASTALGVTVPEDVIVRLKKESGIQSLSSAGNNIFMAINSDTEDKKRLLGEILSPSDVLAALLNKIVSLNLHNGILERGINSLIYGGSRSYTFTVEAAGHDTKKITVSIVSDSSDKKTEPVEVTVKQGTQRGVSSLTIGELASITSAGGVIAAIIPEMSVNYPGFYTYESVDAFAEVKISPDVPVGWTLVWNAFTRNTTGGLKMEDAEDDTVLFYDSEGNVIVTVPEDHIVNVSAWLDEGKNYAPIISAVHERPDPAEDAVPSSSGGCTSFTALAMLIPLAVIFRKR